MLSPELISNLFFLALSYAWDNQAWKKVDTSVRQIFYEASQQYREAFEARHGNIRILTMNHPLRCENLYVPLQFHIAGDEQDCSTLAGMERLTKAPLWGSLPNHLPTCSVEDWHCVNRHPFLIIIGPPGSGKTLFLRRVGLEALRPQEISRYEHRKIPVYLDLNKYNISGLSIVEAIANEFEICRLPDSQRFSLSSLESGDLLILLDGIDDLADQDTAIRVHEIQDLVDRYPNNRYVLSRKRTSKTSYLSRFVNAWIQEFNTLQIYQFCRTWFAHTPDGKGAMPAKDLEALIETLGDICQHPLLLTLICLLQQHHEAPIQRHIFLYESALKTLLETWPKEKRGIHYAEPWQSLYRRQQILAEVASIGFQENRTLFLEREIIQIAIRALNNSQEEVSPQNTLQILNSFVYDSGLLSCHVDGNYGFRFTRIQEYLTAYQLTTKTAQIDGLVQKKLLDHQWQQIFIFASGLDRTDTILRTLWRYTNELSHIPDLTYLLNWSSQVVDRRETTKSHDLRRAIAIFTVLEVCSLYGDDSHYQNALFSCSKRLRDVLYQLNQTTKMIYILDPKLLRSVHIEVLLDISLNLITRLQASKLFSTETRLEKLARKIAQLKNHIGQRELNAHQRKICISYVYSMWLTALQLDPEQLLKVWQGLEALRDYLLAYSLLLRCREAAPAVSPELWMHIQNGLWKGRESAPIAYSERDN